MKVALRNVTKRFGDLLVVNDVTLEIADGELFFLLGPSGCGKTTLLRCVAGFYIPESGQIWIGDTDATRLPPHQRDTGMVFQSYALWPHLTVRENVAFGLELRGLSKPEIQQRVNEALAMVRMTERADYRPPQLSGGQQQRVALARALVIRPKCLLLDEPLSNLDAKLRATMRGELKRFHLDLETTSIYVTHDQLEAMTMSDLIAVMDQGVVQQYGTPEEVYDRPANLFVAGFIGSPPMNFAEAEVASDAGAPALRLAGRTIPAPPQFDLAAAPRRLTLGIRPQDVRIAAIHGLRQIGDARGWLATRSAAITPEVTGTHDWTLVEVDYRTLADTREVEVLARRLEGGGAVTGKAWYRGVQIQEMLPRAFPAVPYLSAIASRRGRGTVYAMLMNKHLRLPLKVEVRVEGFAPRGAMLWVLSGERVDATNESNPNAVRVVRVSLGKVGRTFTVELPPHSMAALSVSSARET